MLQFLLLSTLALAERGPASCEISHGSVVSKTASGIAQVGNLGLIQIRCHVGARLFPLTPGSFRNGLKADATVYNIAVEGARKPVPSEVTVSGGGLSGETEWVDFYIHIPLEVAERDAEIRRYIATLERSEAEADLPEPIRRLKRDPKILAAMVTQNRAGHFQVDCRVWDGETVIGAGSVGLDVLFTGHFFDALAPKKRMTPP
ncbi:MAG: hypothetical protein JWQ87_5080 [Candidatus Sulfotelmatobacter sp.]|nr:hypothetical protein [Candidatus Sulfotelmatobacter sp.]